MPLLPAPAYRPPWPFRSGHVQTIYASAFRRVGGVAYRRERIELPDGDFLDVDWVKTGSDRLAVLSHGLEGSAARGYMRGMARTLSRRGWDVAAWNFRGCSGTPNRLLRSYHSGATGDLHHVVQHALGTGGYRQAALVGFSLGGNLTLKYIGERPGRLDPRLRAAVVFSVPCKLAAATDHLDGSGFRLYRRNFLRSLREKMRAKHRQFPDRLSTDGLGALDSLRAFDDRYTAPLHGFDGASDYYARCSSLGFLPGIALPTLFVNAADDPFLPEACYPTEAARDHPCLYLERPRYGGHVGFVAFDEAGAYWSEQRAGAFLDRHLSDSNA